MTAGRCHCEALDTEWLFLLRSLPWGGKEENPFDDATRGGMGKNYRKGVEEDEEEKRNDGDMKRKVGRVCTFFSLIFCILVHVLIFSRFLVCCFDISYLRCFTLLICNNNVFVLL